MIIAADPGDAPDPASLGPLARARRLPTCIAWAHNETSTGVMVPVARPAGAGRRAGARSTPPPAPAGCPSTSSQADAYYFAPQKCFAGDGGLWLALLSPAAQERIEALHASDRWIPPFLSLHTAARELAEGPDLQHARRRDAVPARRPDPLDARRRRPRLVRRDAPPPPRRTCTAGRRRATTRRRS